LHVLFNKFNLFNLFLPFVYKGNSDKHKTFLTSSSKYFLHNQGENMFINITKLYRNDGDKGRFPTATGIGWRVGEGDNITP
jgi:hypothetical protein